MESQYPPCLRASLHNILMRIPFHWRTRQRSTPNGSHHEHWKIALARTACTSPPKDRLSVCFDADSPFDRRGRSTHHLESETQNSVFPSPEDIVAGVVESLLRKTSQANQTAPDRD